MLPEHHADSVLQWKDGLSQAAHDSRVFLSAHGAHLGEHMRTSALHAGAVTQQTAHSLHTHLMPQIQRVGSTAVQASAAAWQATPKLYSESLQLTRVAAALLTEQSGVWLAESRACQAQWGPSARRMCQGLAAGLDSASTWLNGFGDPSMPDEVSGLPRAGLPYSVCDMSLT